MMMMMMTMIMMTMITYDNDGGGDDDDASDDDGDDRAGDDDDAFLSCDTIIVIPIRNRWPKCTPPLIGKAIWTTNSEVVLLSPRRPPPYDDEDASSDSTSESASGAARSNLAGSLIMKRSHVYSAFQTLTDVANVSRRASRNAFFVRPHFDRRAQASTPGVAKEWRAVGTLAWRAIGSSM